MTTITFDTHAFVKRLIAAGMPEPQAEVLADQQTKLIDDKLATKHDLEMLRLATQNDLELLKRDLTIRMGTIVGAAVAVLSTLITILLRFPAPHP